MAIILLVLLVALLLAGFGFAVHVLWYVAVVVFLFWLAGWAFGRGNWYRRR